jgi:hypothetical protein
MKAKLIKTEKGYYIDTGSFDGIHLACYPHDVTKQRLSLKNCEEIFWGLYDTEMDVEVEMKKVKDETKIVGAVKGVKGSGNKITTYKSVPKLDADGCLILKRV